MEDEAAALAQAEAHANEDKSSLLSSARLLNYLKYILSISIYDICIY